MPTYTQDTIEKLMDGDLPWSQIKSIMSSYKDADRFEKYLSVLQERVPWEDTILLPLGPNLFIVQTSDGRRITKGLSRHEFGDYRENWKLKARIRVRRTAEEFQELYPKYMHATPGWMELREYFDPVSGALLEVEAVPPGYPVVHSFQPDLETFYNEWLGKPLPPRSNGQS